MKAIAENWEGEYVEFPKKIDLSQLSKKELKKMQAQQKKEQKHFLNQQRAEGGQTETKNTKEEAPKEAKPQQQPKQEQSQNIQKGGDNNKKQQQQQPKQEKKGGNNDQKQENAKGGKGKGGGGGGKPKPKPGSDEDLFQKFGQLEIRVGTLDKVWKHPDSEKLWCEQINIGSEVREIASGLQQAIPLTGNWFGHCCGELKTEIPRRIPK